MKNKAIIIISSIIVITAVIFVIILYSTNKINVDDYISEDTTPNTVADYIKLVHEIDYVYNDNLDYNERDWLISNEPDYMSGVLESCAKVLESYYNMDMPCNFEYSSSSEYSYNDESGSEVCLLTSQDNTLNSFIVEISDNKVFLYEIQLPKE